MKELKEKVNNTMAESTAKYGFVHLSEEDKLLQDALRPDIEKFRLFTKMLRRSALLNTAQIQSK